MTPRVPDPNLPPQSQKWARSVEERLDALGFAAGLNAQDSGNTALQLGSSVQVLSRNVQGLRDGTILASGVSDTLSLTVPGGVYNTIYWDSVTTMPEIWVNTPYSQVIVNIGCFATANGVSTSDFVYAFMGLNVANTIPTTDYGDWPSVSSQNPVSGSSFSANLQLTRLVTVTPNTNVRFAIQYGFGRQGGAGSTTSVTFSGRYVSIIPIPD